jgi:L-asparaginase
MGVRIIATGGTIASIADESGAVRAALTPEDLTATVPALQEYGPITSEEVARVNGWNVTPAMMLDVSKRVEAAFADDSVDGAIVTHGTDTVEETAFLLDITVGSEKPVAFAAAMRSGDEVGAEGPRNLLNAAAVASHKGGRGIGSVLVLNDEVHAARWATKLDSFRVNAFSSPDRGPMGLVTPAGLRFRWKPERRLLVQRPASLDVAVPVVKTYTGLEENLIEAVLDATQAVGLVVEGTGLGNVPGPATRGIEAALERGLPVIISTRVITGGTGSVYGGPGGGATLRRSGVIPAGFLSTAKARLLLMLLLASEISPGEVGPRFKEAVAILS